MLLTTTSDFCTFATGIINQLFCFQHRLVID